MMAGWMVLETVLVLVPLTGGNHGTIPEPAMVPEPIGTIQNDGTIGTSVGSNRMEHGRREWLRPLRWGAAIDSCGLRARLVRSARDTSGCHTANRKKPTITVDNTWKLTLADDAMNVAGPPVNRPNSEGFH